MLKHEWFKIYLDKNCVCKEEHIHAQGKATEEYTKDLIAIIVRHFFLEKMEMKSMKRSIRKEELEFIKEMAAILMTADARNEC